jgi:YidC/Oxa1 family membrane protein insertase
MEVRSLLAVILCFLVLLLYFNYFSPRPAKEPAPSPPEEVKTQQEKVAEAVVSRAEEIAPAPPQPVTFEPRSDKIVTPMHEIAWSNLHGALTKARLTEREGDRYKYPDEGRKNPLILLQSPSEDADILLLADPVTGEDISQSGYEVAEQRDTESGDTITFKTVLPTNVSVTKRFLFRKNTYHLVLEVEFYNHSTAAVPVGYELLVSSGIALEIERAAGGAVIAQGSAGSIDLTEIPPQQIVKKGKIEYTGGAAWAGLTNRYFACVLCPSDSTTRGAIDLVRILPAVAPTALAQKEATDFFTTQTSDDDGKPLELKMLNVRVSFRSKIVELQPGQSITHSYLLYIGPKDARVLESYKDYGLAKLVDYGTFASLSKLFLWILRGIFLLIPNYGVAIIILTLIVRGGLHPVSRKQQASFMKHQQVMAKLQPELAKLKEKYKKNKQKLYIESSKLYKQHGIRALPAGGCLLMLLQIPVFIGLYWALSLSIELRQARFVWWMQDLSQPDGAHLPRLGFEIPILGTNMLNILPIIMIAVMVIQNLMQTKPADPQQAHSQKISMYFMVIFFAFIFYSVPSGLVLYFLTSSAIGVLETYIIRKSLASAQVAISK